MIYFVIFLISLFFIYLGLSTKKRNLKKILIILGLLAPCFLAGLRGVSVGTDTKGYVLGLYNIAKDSSSLTSFFTGAKAHYVNSDILYLIITYFSSKFNFGFNLMLFLFEFLIIFPLYKTFNLCFNDKKQIVFAMFLFFMTFFNLTLNMVRQSIAISLFLLSFSIYINKKNKFDIIKSIILILCAIEFHDLTIVTIPLFLLYEILMHDSIGNKVKKYLCHIINLMLIAFLIFHRPLLNIIGHSIYPKALVYLNKYSVFDFDFTSTIINLILIIILIIRKKWDENQDGKYNFWFELSIINFIVNLLRTFIAFSYRISYFFYYLLLLTYIPKLLVKSSVKNNLKGNLIFYLFCSLFTIYWFLFSYFINNNQTMPYVFLK